MLALPRNREVDCWGDAAVGKLSRTGTVYQIGSVLVVLVMMSACLIINSWRHVYRYPC